GVVVLFFLHADDGIRDFHVTGVQTCALPILLPRAGSRAAGGGRGLDRTPAGRAARAAARQASPVCGAVRPAPLRRGGADDVAARSGERRVGEECSARWATGAEKKRRQGATAA